MLGVYTPSGQPIAPQLMRLYDPNCMGNYYLDRDGKWMWDPNCLYKGTGPISGADDFMGLNDVGEFASSPWNALYWVASTAVASASAYHGYKRNNGSVGWAIGWFFFGGLLPFLAAPIALAEGFGKPKKE